jgi:cyclic-di-AMP phosphodiesterase PgpH
VSADAIMAHVVSGAKILREGGIPEPVVEFAYTHHGTQIVEYFWHKCLNSGNPKGLSEEHFRYPGMKPQAKETAILMLVDSIEAASRTIDPPEREKFEEMIQRILFTKLRAGQLDESGLTVADLRTLVTRMSDTLVNMFHHRIRYPWQDQRRISAQHGLPSSSGVASLTVRGTIPSAPPSVVEGRALPSIPAESGGAPPSRDREPPPSIIVGPPLSLVPSPPSEPPSQETTSPSTAPSFPQKKG